MQFDNLLYLIDIFSDLEPETVNQIAAACKWQRYAKGQEVISQKEDSTDVFFVVEGRVSASGYSREGKEVTYSEISRGELFGEFSAIDQKPRSAAIKTLEESHIGQLSAAKFREILIAHPSISLKLLEQLVSKNRYLTERIFEFSTLAVRYRVCAELMRMVDLEQVANDTYAIEPAPSHYQIATRLSTHREAVTRELSSLAQQGIVDVGRQKIHILSVSQLAKLAQSEL